MKKSIVLLLMAVCTPFLVMAQNVVDDLYYVPSKTKKEQTQAAEQKTEAEAARKTVVVKSVSPATTVVVPEGTKVVVNGSTKNKRSVDEYNRRYTGDATASNKKAVVKGDTNYDEELDGEWVNGFDGTEDDYEYATRIIRFRNPRFAISISSPFYWDIVYGLNSWEWNVFVDDYYAYVFPTWTNRLWYDWRFSSIGWGWGWSTWYHPWYTSWYSPWHFGWSWGWHSPWYTGWYGGWYGGWHSPYHGYYSWGGYHYRPQNYTFRGQPGARSNYSSTTRRGSSGGSRVGVNGSSVRTRTGNTGTRVRTTNGTSVRSNSTGTRTNTGRVVNSSTGTRVRTNSTGTGTRSTVTPSTNGTRARSNSTGTTINTRRNTTVRSSTGTTGTRSVSPSTRTQSNRSYTPGSSSSTRVRSNSGTSTRSSSPTRSYSGSSSTRSYSGGGFSGGGSTRSSGGGFSGGGGSSRGGGGGGTRSR